MMNFSNQKPGRGMPPLPLRTAAALTGALAWTALTAHAQAPVKKMSYDNFHMMQTRNIFDPDRNRDYSPQTSRPKIRTSDTGPTPPPVAQKNDYVQLTGVMVTEGETFAFFAGSTPEYNKVVGVNGTIAGATITKITSSGINVARNGKEVAVNVGMTVPLDDSSAPGLPPSAVPVVITATPAATATTTGPVVDPRGASEQVPLPDTTPGSPASSAPQSTDNMSDAMRRMIERRQKELNNQ